MSQKLHGFWSGRSCLSQLFEYHNNILEKLVKSNNVGVIYLDFAKQLKKSKLININNRYSVLNNVWNFQFSTMNIEPMARICSLPWWRLGAFVNVVIGKSSCEKYGNFK